ncbi:RNA polymerase I-specific transcription initiation factor RRN3 [Nadsonia fulvescens var. elongata DSM 6958]|uniref:RNA polymerase I-specific transcription initiation factor RRN3 n=1 Tax=Nadsonia fulvescens var. elongata DSM 6958 TaxID=857566 RepID=A0A1E3PQC8_9ASCO|nr:RNA polymerase I-specific transcription initiation factor RRN3 [Nadsonia fulvescens var. elongata DSM 6958]
MYWAYVKNALNELEQHNPTPLNALSNQFSLPASSAEAPSPTQLLFTIKALTTEVSRLDNAGCHALISAILAIKWARNDRKFVDVYVRFLGVLVSGIPKWWNDAAASIVQGFTMPDTEAHHTILSYIISLIPTASVSLSNILTDFFPHKNDKIKNITRYITNILRVTNYCPETTTSVWALIIERCVQIDSELQDEINMVDDFDEDEIHDNIDESSDEENGNEKELEVKASNSQSGRGDTMLGNKQNARSKCGNSQESEDEEEEDDYDMYEDGEDVYHEVNSVDQVSVLANKLDYVLVLLFEHLQTKFTYELLSSGDSITLFRTLLNLFKTYLLPTHKTRAVQYLLFKVSQLHPELMDAFLVSLIEIALSPTENPERRQKAMQYVSSYIARANELSKTQIVFVISILTGWTEKYIQEREQEIDGSSGGMQRFKIFYSVVQGLFYIFCFRHAMLKSDDFSVVKSTTSVWECNLDTFFQRLIVTKFNPLKFCTRTIVGMFAKIAQKEDVAYCFTIIEQNRRGISTPTRSSSFPNSPITPTSRPLLDPIASSLWVQTEDFVQMDGYFPFDPLSLKKSKHYIQDIYVSWDAEDSDSDSESDSDEDLSDDE